MTTRIHLARPGQYRDMHDRTVALDEPRIRDLATSYNEGGWRAPLVLGHPTHDAQAHGWVTSLEVDDKGELYGEVDQVSPELSDWVRDGRYRNVSISWWGKGHANNPSKASDTLRHVGILGGQPPAIAGLTPLAFADDAGVVTIELGDETWRGWWSVKNFMRGVRDLLIAEHGVEKVDRALPDYLIDNVDSTADEAAQEIETSFSDPKPEDEMSGGNTGAAPKTKPADPAPTDLADRKAELDQRERDIAEREKSAADAEEGARKDRAVAFCDGLVQQGKLAPAGRDIVEHIHQALASGNEPISFSDGAQRPPLAEFEKLLSGGTPIVNLSEMTKGDASTKDVDDNDAVALADRGAEIRKERPSLSVPESIREAQAEKENSA